MASVETLQTALPHHNIAQAKDFVRLHPDEENYWSAEFCFVNVPIKGQKHDTLHLIDEDLAMRLLAEREEFCAFGSHSRPNRTTSSSCAHVPTQNLDNAWNITNLQACEQAKTLWTQATSRKEEGVEAYKIDVARDPDAFPRAELADAIAWRSHRQDLRRTHDRTRRPPGAAAPDRREAVAVVSKTSTRSSSATSNTRSATASSRTCCAWSRTC